MAKTSSVEKNNRRRRMAKQYAGKRARLKAIAEPVAVDGRAFRGAAQACAIAAQFGADPHPQSL